MNCTTTTTLLPQTSLHLFYKIKNVLAGDSTLAQEEQLMCIMYGGGVG